MWASVHFNFRESKRMNERVCVCGYGWSRVCVSELYRLCYCWHWWCVRSCTGIETTTTTAAAATAATLTTTSATTLAVNDDDNHLKIIIKLQTIRCAIRNAIPKSDMHCHWNWKTVDFTCTLAAMPSRTHTRMRVKCYQTISDVIITTIHLALVDDMIDCFTFGCTLFHSHSESTMSS